MKDNLLLIAFGTTAAMSAGAVWLLHNLSGKTQAVAQEIFNKDDNGPVIGMHAPDMLPSDRTYTYPSSSSDVVAERSTTATPTSENPNNTHSAYTVYRAFQVTQALTRVLFEMVPDGDRSNPLTKECLDEMEKIIKENREMTKTLIETGGLLLKYLSDLKDSNREAFDALILGFESAVMQARNNPEFIHDAINVAGEFAIYFNELNKTKPKESARVLQYLVEVTEIFSERPQLIEGMSKGAFCIAETLYELEREYPEHYKRMCRGAERLILGMGSSPEFVGHATKVVATAVAATEEYVSTSSDHSDDLESATKLMESATKYAAENPGTVEKMTRLTLKAASKVEEIKERDPELAEKVKEKLEEILDDLDKNPEKVDQYLEMSASICNAMIRWEKRLRNFDSKDAAGLHGAFDLDTDQISSPESTSKKEASTSSSSSDTTSIDCPQSVRKVIAESLPLRDQAMLAVMAQVGITPEQIFEKVTREKTDTEKKTSKASSSSDDSSSFSSDTTDSSSPSPTRRSSSSSSEGGTSSSTTSQPSPQMIEAVASILNSSPETRDSLQSCLGSTATVMRAIGMDPMDAFKK